MMKIRKSKLVSIYFQGTLAETYNQSVFSFFPHFSPLEPDPVFGTEYLHMYKCILWEGYNFMLSACLYQTLAPVDLSNLPCQSRLYPTSFFPHIHIKPKCQAQPSMHVQVKVIVHQSAYNPKCHQVYAFLMADKNNKLLF